MIFMSALYMSIAGTSGRLRETAESRDKSGWGPDYDYSPAPDPGPPHVLPQASRYAAFCLQKAYL